MAELVKPSTAEHSARESIIIARSRKRRRRILLV